MFLQGAEEEEAEHYTDEETPAATSESKPSAVDGPTKIEEQEEAEREGVEQSKEESKAEEKGNLAGERQSGDGQVTLTPPARLRLDSQTDFQSLVPSDFCLVVFPTSVTKLHRAYRSGGHAPWLYSVLTHTHALAGVD